MYQTVPNQESQTGSMELNLQASQRFLSAACYDLSNLKGLEIRQIKDGFVRISWPEDVGSLCKTIEQANRDMFNVYFSICPREGRRGDKDHVLQSNMLWIDLDGAKFDPDDPINGKKLGLEQLHRALPSELKPSIIIDSGYGYHCYWLMTTPWAMDMNGSRLAFEAMLRRLAIYLKADRSAAEVARVFRLPGTYNQKDAKHPRLCRILVCDPERKVSITDFDQFLPKFQEVVRTSPRSSALTEQNHPILSKTLVFLEHGAPKGERNNRAFQAAAEMCGAGYTEEETLEKIVQAARVCELPEAEARNVVKSAFSKPRTPAIEFISSAPELQATDLDTALNALPMTDTGAGEGIIKLYGNELRYDHTKKCWLGWDEHRWKEDLDGKAYRLAVETARRRQAAAIIKNPDNKVKLVNWALRCEGKNQIEAALKMASTMPPIAATTDLFDRDPWLLACTNGVLDTRTRFLRPGRPSDMITLSTGIPYLPGEPCPRWIRFLGEIFSADEGRFFYIQNVTGYCLTGSLSEQKFYILSGTGWNGKSVFLNTLRKVWGDYAQNITSSTVLADPRGPKLQTNDLAALKGRRLITAVEVNDGSRLDEARVKAMTGGDPITARYLHKEFFTYDPHFKLFLAVNHKPNIWGTDESIWRRIDLIPFTVKFTRETADRYLADELAGEAPGILAWAVEGCLRWQQDGLGHAEAVSQATSDYRVECDLLGEFLRDRTISVPGSRIQSSQLHKAYQQWAEDNHIRPLSNIALSKKLVERGFEKESCGHVYFLGLELRPEEDGEF